MRAHQRKTREWVTTLTYRLEFLCVALRDESRRRVTTLCAPAVAAVAIGLEDELVRGVEPFDEREDRVYVALDGGL